MIKPLSLTGDYHLVWSRDPALDAPPEPAADAAPDSEAAVTWKAWQERFRIARQTGKPEAWQALMKPGQVPTLFRMRQVPTTTAGKLLAIARTGDLDVTFEVMPLAFRVALMGVEQWAPGSDFKLERKTDATYPKLGQIATEEAVDRLTLQVAAELGSVVLMRCQEADPLS